MTLRKFLLIFSVTGSGVLFLAAWAIPRFLLSNDDNIERLVGGDPKAVEYAREVRWLIGHGHCSQLAALTCTGVRIGELKPMKITPRSDKLPQVCPYPYQGKVVVYGLFGIPSQHIWFDCDLVEP